MMGKRIIVLLLLVGSLSGCAWMRPPAPPRPAVIELERRPDGRLPESYVVNGDRYYPLPHADGFTETGWASWYGRKFHGRPTSSGEVFDMYRKSAAHKTLPLGTYVKVLHLRSKRHVVVRINDRGPFVKGRVIDLSYAAAKELNMIQSGVAEVKITALGREVGKTRRSGDEKPLLELKDLKTGDFTVQIGAFENKENARRLAERLRVVFDHVEITVHVDDMKRVLHRVRVSKSKTLKDAGKMEKRLEDMGFAGAFIVRL